MISVQDLLGRSVEKCFDSQSLYIVFVAWRFDSANSTVTVLVAAMDGDVLRIPEPTCFAWVVVGSYLKICD